MDIVIHKLLIVMYWYCQRTCLGNQDHFQHCVLSTVTYGTETSTLATQTKNEPAAA